MSGLKFARGGQKRVVIIVMAVLLLAAIGTSVFLFIQNNQLKNNPNTIAAKETEDLVSKVGKLIALPQGESPTMATIQDKDKLKDQPFFNDAQNGDKMLIYSKAKKAIIYREKSNKIINVGPITLNDDQGNTTDNEAKDKKQ